jgi:hypothetical protein
MMGNWRLAGLLLCLTILSACGVQLEIATPPPPTPTLRPGALLRALDSDYRRPQAKPRLVFGDSGNVAVELFMQRAQETLYVVQYRAVWLSVEYDVTWFGTPQGNARIRLKLYRRISQEAAWEDYAQDERELRTSSVPQRLTDSLGSNFYEENIGRYFVRAEVNVVVYPPSGQVINQVSTNDFTAVVLRDPGEVKTEGEALAAARVPLGDLPVDKLFFDWRIWGGGPCVLRVPSTSDPSGPNIRLACDALAQGDPVNARNALSVAIGQAQDAKLIAPLNAQLGLLAAFTGEYSLAARAFGSAVSAYESAADALPLTSALHNLASVSFAQGDGGSGGQALAKLSELRSQFWDEFGYRLTQANVAFVDKDSRVLEDVRWYFESAGLPEYRTVIDAWRDQLLREAQNNP